MLSEFEVAHGSQDPAGVGGGWGVLAVDTSPCSCGALKVRLEGDLDVYSTRDLLNQLIPAEAGATDVVIDLSRLKFIDCAGVRQLVEAQQRIGRRGGRLKLIKGPQRVHRVFTLTGLETAFDFEPPGRS
jgi:anti-sigma B factor antagonist